MDEVDRFLQKINGNTSYLENGCIESYKLGINPLAISLPDNMHSCSVEYDRRGQDYFNLYSHQKNGHTKRQKGCSVVIVEPIRHSMTEREAGLPEITYNISFYHSVV